MMAMLRCTSQCRMERSCGVFMASIETDPSFLLFWLLYQNYCAGTFPGDARSGVVDTRDTRLEKL